MESGTLKSYDDYELKRKLSVELLLIYLDLKKKYIYIYIFVIGDVLIKVNGVVCK